MAEVQAENRRLTEPLQKAHDQVSDLQRQLSSYEKDKVLLAVGFVRLRHHQLQITLCVFKSTKARLKELEETHENLKWEHEVLLQRFESVNFGLSFESNECCQINCPL
jgi:hypothetical protein